MAKKARIQNLTRTVVFPVVLTIMLHIHCSLCIDFHRNTTGVAFSTYVHNNVPDTAHLDWTSYSLQDVKTMMKVIAGRFSKISTFGVGAGAVRETYVLNQTYYRSYSQVFAGEAAAMVNKEMSVEMKENALKIYLGIYLFENEEQLDMEMDLAMESVEKANSIYPGTVEGLVWSHYALGFEEKPLIAALEKINQLKEDTANPKPKLGTRQDCEGLEPQDTKDATAITSHRIEILQITDFIICEVHPDIVLGPDAALATIKSKLLEYKKNLQKINPQLQVMGQTGWPANANHSAEVNDMQQYWKLVNAWAAEENFTMWMLEAFDNPWKHSPEPPNLAHFGWWKLTQDSKTGVEQGYIEKIQLNPSRDKTEIDNTASAQEETAENNTVLIVVIAVAVLALVVAITVFFTVKKIYYQRVNRSEPT